MDKLRVASCQFPVTDYIGRYMQKAAAEGARLLHTSEACLSGYSGLRLQIFAGYDWDQLRWNTTCLRDLAAELDQWLVLGSAHFLSARSKPTNCLYLIGPWGQIIDRYDKCMCTGDDQQHYSAGNRLVVKKINGVKVGLAICYDICYPQIYAAYRERGAELMLHSFYNARGSGPNCLDVLNKHQVTTRCADNTLWAVANNSSHPYSNWASFVARPDATIAQQLPQNRPGLLVHDFPDGLSEGGWLHNSMPMKLAPNEKLWLGKPSAHSRQKKGQSEP